jgi:c-di-GMP-binding flagellar brake protein YcgR
MNNRRETYRHSFTTAEQVEVELALPGEQTTRRGEVIDLSIEGMQVRLDVGASPRVEEELTARLLGRPVPPVQLGLSVISQVKYVRRHGSHVYCGIHFLTAASPAVNDQRESTLGRFLAEEQRRELRRRLPHELEE